MEGLRIHGLAVPCHIGCYDWEQRIMQTLYLDIEIPYKISAVQDDLAKTVDYAKLCAFIVTYLQAQSFKLIETVASSVAQALKAEFGLTTVTLTVSKPNAVKKAKNISVSFSI